MKIGIDEHFDVHGEQSLLPSDPAGSFEQTANCRCFVDYVDEGEGEVGEVSRVDGRLAEFQGDRKFIEAREGGLRADGNIPIDKNGEPIDQSGVTIGAGVDLGQQTRAGLATLGVDEQTLERLTPYLGKRREEAQRVLREQPLYLSVEEARDLTNKLHDGIFVRLVAAYDRESTQRFFDLASEAQTVIASVSLQYGPNFGPKGNNKAPKFWGFVTQGDWQSALEELRDFGDGFQNRRDLEADKLLKAFPNLNDPGKLPDRKKP